MSPVISLISLLKLHSFTGQVHALNFFFGNVTLEISFTQQVLSLKLQVVVVIGLLFAFSFSFFLSKDCSLLGSWHHCIYPAMLQRHDLEVWTVWSSRMNTMNALLGSSSSPARSLARAFNAPTINQNYSTDD